VFWREHESLTKVMTSPSPSEVALEGIPPKRAASPPPLPSRSSLDLPMQLSLGQEESSLHIRPIRRATLSTSLEEHQTAD
jgi:hypothetical protein